MTGAIKAFGTLLKRGAVTVAEVRNISGPGLSLDTRDVTSHSSTGGWREFIGALLDGGEVTFDINFIPTNATHKNAAGGLINDMTTRTVTAYSITFPDASVWSFSALITKMTPAEPVDGELSASVTMKLTGVPTLV